MLQTYTWTQIGSDIDGEAKGDGSGVSVSMSTDGTRVAIGSYGSFPAGHVRVFSESGGNWTKIGDTITGEAGGDRSGVSVSMSSDGTRVAIGASTNDGNGLDAGHVRVYAESGGTWTQIGSDIDGERTGDQFGVRVSMSADGARVAIGAVFNDDGGNNAGKVRVYAENGGTWTLVGGDIDGEAAGDQFGRSVSMSSDGTRVAIGTPYNDGTDTDAGHVRVYEDISGTWTQVGGDIDGEAAGDQFGKSVSMSSDGTRVAIGAPSNDGAGTDAGHVRVYAESGGAWTQVGSDIGGAAGDRSGISVSMSTDGTRVAIGAPYDGGAGHVRVYSDSGGMWTLIADQIEGEAKDDQSGISVSMSSDGRVAIGAYGNDGNGISAGHVRVFQFGVPCNPPAVAMHAGEVVGGLGECDGIEKIPHLSTCTITCNTAEGYYVEGPAMCNQGTLIGGVKCLCTKGHPRPWHGTLACQKRMRGIHIPGTFHDEL